MGWELQAKACVLVLSDFQFSFQGLTQERIPQCASIVKVWLYKSITEQSSTKMKVCIGDCLHFARNYIKKMACKPCLHLSLTLTRVKNQALNNFFVLQSYPKISLTAFIQSNHWWTFFLCKIIWKEVDTKLCPKSSSHIKGNTILLLRKARTMKFGLSTRDRGRGVPSCRHRFAILCLTLCPLELSLPLDFINEPGYSGVKGFSTQSIYKYIGKVRDNLIIDEQYHCIKYARIWVNENPYSRIFYAVYEESLPLNLSNIINPF